MDKQQLKEFLYKLPYDYLCQDIEAIDLIGHSKSHKTWELMKDMYGWYGARVLSSLSVA